MLKTGLLSLVLFVIVFNAEAQSSNDLLIKLREGRADTNRISLQLRLASFYLSKPGESKNDLDSAYQFINQATRLSGQLHETDWQYKTMIVTGSYFAKRGDLEGCRKYIMQVIKKLPKAGNLSKEAGAWVRLGDLFENNGKDDHKQERKTFYQNARTLYLKAREPLNATHVLVNLAVVEVYEEINNVAEKHLLQALEEYKKLHYKSLQNTYRWLAAAQAGNENYYRALTYASEGIKVAESNGDTALAAELYEELARYNFLIKNFGEALRWLRKAMILDPEQFNYKCHIVSALLALDKVDEARIALNLARKYEPSQPHLNKAMYYRAAGLYYAKINKNALAIQFYQKILDPDFINKFNRQSKDYWSMRCNNDVAGIYLKINKPEKAKKYIDDAGLIIYNEKYSDPHELVEFYGYSYKYDLSANNYQSAVKNLELRDKLQDSLFSVNRDNKFADLVMRFETAQKEQSIKDLHSQAAIQEAKLQTAHLQMSITIVTVLVMIAISALIYRYYRQKKSANNTITQKNHLLQHLLTEKEWLLKEVHHRVKNNLHTVICLLESQARYLENDALEAIETSQHRIYAMSLIHQKLYQSDDIKSIDMATYIPELVKSLEDGFGVSDQIQFQLNIQPISLSLSHAIPLALIINEAVTNSIKYAFPDKKNGVITITMFDNGIQTLLELADNGIGMLQIDNYDEPESMGLRLIKGLCEDIDASIRFEILSGTRIIITFNNDPLNDADNHPKLTNLSEEDI